MGLLSRTKGKVFERKIAQVIRPHFPYVTVRRASQAERAHNPDLFFESEHALPPILDRLWLELEDSATPNPRKKLEQSERDLRSRFPVTWQSKFPVVVWHLKGSRTIWATARARTLRHLLGDLKMYDVVSGSDTSLHDVVVVQVDFEDLLRMLRVREPADVTGPPID